MAAAGLATGVFSLGSRAGRWLRSVTRDVLRKIKSWPTDCAAPAPHRFKHKRKKHKALPEIDTVPSQDSIHGLVRAGRTTEVRTAIKAYGAALLSATDEGSKGIERRIWHDKKLLLWIQKDKYRDQTPLTYCLTVCYPYRCRL